MRLYEVRPGDSPASIAARDDMAGCPRCSRDLVLANSSSKEVVTHPNGYLSFRELRVGEKLVLPEKWFTKAFDELPASYFASLPHPDGVTPTKSGTVGALGDYSTLDSAIAHAAMLAPMDDAAFNQNADATATLIDQSVRDAKDGNLYAQATHTSTAWARRSNADLAAALVAGDSASAQVARESTQNALLTAIESAKLALQAISGGVTVDIGPATIDNLPAIAQAAATAMSDPNFCASVSQPGSTTNAAVHAFKTAWNAANPGNPVPINTGTYDQATADAITKVLGSAPAACAPRATGGATPPSFSLPADVIVPPQTSDSAGLNTASMMGLGLLGAGVVGGAIYIATKKPRVRVRRVRVRRVRA